MADVAELVWEIDSSQARGAAKALGDLNGALIKTANASANFEKTLRGANGQFQSTAKYLRDHSSEVEALARAYNPVLSAQIQYRNETIKTAAAVKAGVITEQERVDILRRTKTALEQTANAARQYDAANDMSAASVKRFGEAQQVATHHATNLSYQLNDIGMMMAMGQNPFMLMIQQGPQVAQIFSSMAAEGRKLGPTLASSFRMFLNPTTAVTLALIGGSAALVQWGMSALGAGEKAKTAADRVDDLKSAYDALQSVQEKARMSLDERIKAYGREWQSIGLVIDRLYEKRNLEAQLASNDAIKALGLDPRAIQGMENVINDFMAKRNDFSAQSRQMAIEANGYNQEAIQQYGLQYAEMVRLNEVGERLRQNDLGLGERNRLTAEFVALTNKGIQAGAEQAENMSLAASAASDFAEEATKAQAAVENADRAMKSFASSASSASLSHLVSQAAALASNMWDAANASTNIGSPKAVGAWGGVVEAAANAWKQALDRADQVQRAGLGQRPGRRSFALSERAMYGPETDGGGGGGGGADRALAQAEKGFQNIRELLEKESLFQVAEWGKRQKQLDVALQKDLVSREQYELMKQQLRTNYFGTEYQKKQLQYDMELEQLKSALNAQLITQQEHDVLMRQRQWEQVARMGEIRDSGTAYELNQMASAFGQAASLAGSYNEKFLKAQRVFAASAALISTYQGAAKALELPFPMNIAAAAKVLAAGMGFIGAIKSGSSGGGGGGASSSSAAAQAQTRQEPTRTVLVNLQGDDWLVNMAESIMTQIYDASKDGRVIVRRDR